MTAMEPVSAMTPKDNQERIEEVARYNIRRYMQLRGVGQKEIADAWGVSQGAVSQRLNGISQIKLTEAVVAAHVLDISMEDILDDTAFNQDKELTSLLARQKEEIRQLKEKFAARIMAAQRENPASQRSAGFGRYVLNSDDSDRGSGQRA